MIVDLPGMPLEVFGRGGMDRDRAVVDFATAYIHDTFGFVPTFLDGMAASGMIRIGV